LGAIQQSVRGHLTERLLRGKLYTPEEVAQCAESLGMPPDNYCVCVMRLGIDGNRDIGNTARANSMLQEFLRERLDMDSWIYNDETHITYFILQLREEAERDLIALQLCLWEAVAQLAQEGICAQIGLGTAARGLKNIGQSTIYAQSALRLTSKEAPVHMYTNSKGRSKTLAYDSGMSQRLNDMLMTGDSRYVNDYFDILLDRIARHPPSTETEICQIYYGIYSTVENVARSLCENCGEIAMPEFSQDQGVREMILCFCKTCLDLCGLMAAQRIQANDRTVNGIVEFIRQHFTNCNMCAQFIADHFSVSEKYVFFSVKNLTGKSLSDYIQYLRFQRTEALLSGDIDINKIPGMVGFNSVNTFYKAFKRTYGISPGKWRMANAG
ncbi:MAG: helix-turn-helix domain-containing protein, partial [Oscillospiraceae bacterium]|nr:helix-turn-helix domain-containing protein [Oscillospiraceae bacterium]